MKQRLATQHWTAHNIRLNDEATTNPELYDFLAGDDRLKAILRVFRIVFPGGLAGVSIADLGCLEGGFTLGLALQGAHALGIEARRTNFEKLELLREHFDQVSLDFRLADVKDFDTARFGRFDAVLALGILYHLDNPIPWLRQIADATGRILVVDSHYAPGDDRALRRIDKRLTNLSGLTTVTYGSAKYEGRWFTEYARHADPEPHLWASYSNWRSFWLTKESLVRGMRDAGFALVLEQHDYTADIFERMSVQFPRVLLIGIKP